MSDRFIILETPIQGLKVIERRAISDSRGFLDRIFCVDELSAPLAHRHIAQVNHTLTVRRGTVRGMHFQHAPHGEVKFVNCLRGEVFDVAVDLRRDSPTFLRWHAEVLSPGNHRTMVIPGGCAHGFQTLNDHCEMLYLHTAPYEPGAEGAVNARDPILAIRWPVEISELSPRDSAHPALPPGFLGVEL